MVEWFFLLRRRRAEEQGMRQSPGLDVRTLLRCQLSSLRRPGISHGEERAGGGAPRRRVHRQGLHGSAAGAPRRRRGAGEVVLLPGPHRRVHRDAPLPLHHRGHRHRLQGVHRPEQGLRRGGELRGRRHPRHRLGLRRHDLHPRLLHRRHLRRAHQPGCHLRAAPSEEGVAGAGGALHGGTVPGSHLRGGPRQELPEGLFQPLRRRCELARRRLLQGDGSGGGDHRHLRPRLHRLLRDGPQAQRPRLPRPCFGPPAHRVRRLHGAPRHHPHHRHRHQPGQEPRLCRHLQRREDLGRSVDLLGGTVHRRRHRRRLPPVHPPGRGRQGAGVLPEWLPRLTRARRRRGSRNKM